MMHICRPLCSIAAALPCLPAQQPKTPACLTWPILVRLPSRPLDYQPQSPLHSPSPRQPTAAASAAAALHARLRLECEDGVVAGGGEEIVVAGALGGLAQDLARRVELGLRVALRAQLRGQGGRVGAGGRVRRQGAAGAWLRGGGGGGGASAI
jgi:uncharacterized membrane protein YgcG